MSYLRLGGLIKKRDLLWLMAVQVHLKKSQNGTRYRMAREGMYTYGSMPFPIFSSNKATRFNESLMALSNPHQFPEAPPLSTRSFHPPDASWWGLNFNTGTSADPVSHTQAEVECGGGSFLTSFWHPNGEGVCLLESLA